MSFPDRTFYADDGIRLFHGDALDVLPTWPADTLDAVITDGPYGLGFMGAAWDHGVPGVPFWAGMLRAMKPGAALVAFGGTRTFHRLAVAVEDAGFELRDTLGWVYGSGWPKSLDVGKAIDAAAGAERPVIGEVRKSVAGMEPGLGGAFSDDGFTWKPAFPVTGPATDDAKRWDGWGTGLKPAWEPILLARKPLAGSVAANVLEWGTGALNLAAAQIDGERTRWPANLIHDGSLDGVAGEAARFFYCAKAAPSERWAYCRGCGAAFPRDERQRHGHGLPNWGHLFVHPTQKPLALMKYLVRLTVPPGALIADPFAGSGTTLIAAGGCGVQAVGIERELEHCRIAVGRIGLRLGF